MRTKEELPECPVATAVSLIGGKWKLLSLIHISALVAQAIITCGQVSPVTSASTVMVSCRSVSYTHLDVYKRQVQHE